MSRKKIVRILYANQPCGSKQVSLVPHEQALDLFRASLGMFTNHGKGLPVI